MALVTMIVEVRQPSGGRRDIVVNAGISDLPLARSHPHRVLVLDGRGWEPVPGGRDRVLGRICMEHDVLAEAVGLPEGVRPGQRLAFLEAGGYDASMAYGFGTGEVHDA
jgi:diaminopimelate decarboxylase